MSSNYNSHGYLANGAYSQPDNSYFQDDAFDGFDNSFVPQGAGNPTHDQGWGYAPDRFDLAPSDHHNEQSHAHGSWNSIDPRNTFASDDAPQVQYDNFFALSLPSTSNVYNSSPYPSSSAYNRPITQHASSNGISGGPNIARSPYELQNSEHPQYLTGPGTIAPRALQSGLQSGVPQQTVEASRDATPPGRSGPLPNHHLFRPIPNGQPLGIFVVTTAEDMEKEVQSKALAPFLHVAIAPQDASINRSSLPGFVRRKSRNEIMKLLASDSSLKAKVDKKLSKRLAKQASKPITISTKPDVTKRQVSETPSDVSSSDGDSEDDSEEESMQAPIPAKRPTDSAVEAVKYDTIKTLWRVPYRSAPAEDIRQAMQGFWEIVQTIRDRWKSDILAIKQAEENKKVNELPTLKERAGSQRNLLQSSLKAAVAHGHTDILENFGQHLQLMGAMAVFLQDRIKESDYSGALTKIILEFLTKCKSMTKGIVERSQIGKLLLRVVKRGDETVKALVKRINENASNATEKRREGSTDSTAAVKSKVVKPAQGIVKSSSPPSGIKRPRDSDSDTKLPAKKLVTENSTAKIATGATVQAGSLKRPGSADVKSSNAATSQPVTKKVVAKPSSLFASLQSAKIKPSTSKVSSSSDSTAKNPSGISAVRPSTTPANNNSSSFSFAATMADLTKPKEIEKEVKKEEAAPFESPDERAKRLRKERRRKLRVTFKPESELVEIRLFTHDPEEDFGHDASQVRDVNDLVSEGRMFKQLQHQRDEDAMEIDDEEDSDAEDSSEPKKEYLPPSLIDFSEVPEEERQRNYAPYGGGEQRVESTERVTQEKLKAESLMVIYAHRAEIPPSPREPTEMIEEATQPKPFGEPTEEFKAKLAKLIPTHIPQVPSAPDLSALLGSIMGQQQQERPNQPVQAQGNPSLEDIFSSFSQAGGALSNPQQQQTSAYQYSNAPNPFSQSQQQQLPYQQQVQQAGSMFDQLPKQQQHQQPSGTPDIAALLATLQSNGSLPAFTPLAPPPPPPPPPPQQAQSMPGLAQLSNQTFNPFASAPPPPTAQESEEQRQMRVAAESTAGQAQAQGERAKPKFVVQCKYFREGKCLKGANCTFRHDPE